MSIYKKALKHLEKIEFLVASVRTWKPTVNVRLGGSGDSGATAQPSPITPPDWDHVQDWCIAELEGSAESLRRADRAHREQRVFLQQARLDRDWRLSELESGRPHPSHRALGAPDGSQSGSVVHG